MSRRPTLSLTLIALLLCAGGAGAIGASADTAPSGTATAQPNRTGVPSEIVIDAQGSSSGFGQSLPQGVTVAVFRGFALDLNAVADRCSDSDAGRSACPDSSRVARGQFQGQATFAGIPQHFSGTLEAFLAPASSGDLADIVVEIHVGTTSSSARGRLVAVADPTFGYELRFDPLPAPTIPAGTTVTVDRLSVTIGATRTVTAPARKPGGKPQKGKPRRRRCHRRGHRRCRRAHGRKRRHRGQARSSAGVTYHLITNPSTCPGSWPLELRVRYSDHTDVRAAPIACSG